MSNNVYCVVDTKVRAVVQEGFDKKQDAKSVRNRLNEEANSNADDNRKPRYVVSRGTDHLLGASDGIGNTSKKRQF
jgi:hypothetical protein